MLDPLPPPPAETFTSTTSNNYFRGIFSYDGNIMLAAVISLLLVILFVLLLHVYAKWFLVQARQRSRRSVSVPQVLGPRFHSLITIDTTYADYDESPTKGLESSDISEIPMFVYKVDIDNNPKNNNESLLECAICLSLFEDEEIGRRLPKCGHVFHVECIDMWFHSHSTCPICRDPVVVAAGNLIVDSVNDEVNIVDCDLNEEPLSSVEEEMINGQETLLEIIVEVPIPNPENVNISRKDSISVCSS